MEIYAETQEAVVARYMEQMLTPKGWYFIRDNVNIKSVYRKLLHEGYVVALGNGNYRLNF